MKLPQSLHPLSEEVEFVHCENDFNLELFTLRRLLPGFIENDKIVTVAVAVFQTLQIEAATECTILAVLAGFVRNDADHIADLLSAGIGEVQLIVAGASIIANGFFLIEIQREDHIADFPGR